MPVSKGRKERLREDDAAKVNLAPKKKKENKSGFNASSKEKKACDATLRC